MKILTPLIIIIRYLAATNIFNNVLDFVEVKIIQSSYRETQLFYEESAGRIDKICKYLEDTKSRDVYVNIWKYRATHDRRYLKNIVDKNQYFDRKIVKLDLHEGFVDCGAYKGDTIKKFIKEVGGEYSFIAAFEPDEFNFQCLEKYVRKEKLKNVQCYQAATWNQNEKVLFCGNTEEACKVNSSGNIVVNANMMDTVLGLSKVTFIKMDVEGAELNSLKGAKDIIKKNHPILAISIYHSDEDMINIIEYIIQNYPFYKLYIRHYTYFYADTVLYAVDKNVARESG